MGRLGGEGGCWRVAVTGAEPCPVAGFYIGYVEPSGFAVSKLR
jgi:hypothetical protein